MEKLKKLICAIISASILLSLCACGASKSKYDEATTEVYKQAIGVLNGVINGTIMPDKANVMLEKLSEKIDTSSGELSIRLAASSLTSAGMLIESKYDLAKVYGISSGVVDMSDVYAEAKKQRAEWAEDIGLTEKQASELSASMIIY